MPTLVSAYSPRGFGLVLAGISLTHERPRFAFRRAVVSATTTASRGFTGQGQAAFAAGLSRVLSSPEGEPKGEGERRESLAPTRSARAPPVVKPLLHRMDGPMSPVWIGRPLRTLHDSTRRPVFTPPRDPRGALKNEGRRTPEQPACARPSDRLGSHEPVLPRARQMPLRCGHTRRRARGPPPRAAGVEGRIHRAPAKESGFRCTRGAFRRGAGHARTMRAEAFIVVASGKDEPSRPGFGSPQLVSRLWTTPAPLAISRWPPSLTG